MEFYDHAVYLRVDDACAMNLSCGITHAFASLVA